MLERSDALLRADTRPLPGAHPPEPMMSAVAAWSIVKRHRLLFAFVFVPTLLAGIVYVTLATPQYSATSVLLIDTRSRNPGQQASASSAAIESANVDSQVEVLRSEGMLRSVVVALDLTADPEFMRRVPAPVQWLRDQAGDWLGWDLEPPKVDPTVFAIGIMERNIVVKRLGLSYVIQLDYKSTSAQHAADIANKLVERYVDSQVEVRKAAEDSFTDWLERRTAALRGDAMRAEQLLADRRLAETTNRVTRAYASGRERTPADDPSLQQSLSLAAAEMAQAARDSAELKDFESVAQTSRTLAELYARRLAEFVPQGSAALSEARVISSALPPREKSEPKALLVVGAAIALGALGGLGAATLRERTQKGIRSPLQLEAATGVACFGMLGDIPRARMVRPWRRGSETGRSRFVLDRPASRFAETMRTIRTCIRTPSLSRPGMTIGVVSALSSEGKGVVCANLGHLCAASGIRTLVVELDLRRGGLSRDQAVASGESSIADASASGTPFSEAMRCDPDSGLHILPAIAFPPDAAFRTLSSAAMAQSIGSVAQQFDLVILDLPAILPTADSLALAPSVDSYILVVAWGATEASQIVQSMQKMPEMRERLLGAVLNGAPPAAVRRECAALGMLSDNEDSLRRRS